MSSKIVLEKRRPDTVISECRSVAQMRAKNEGWQSPKPLARACIKNRRIKLVRWFSGGQELRCDSPPSGTTRSHHRLRPAGGSAWQRFVWPRGPTSCDLYCSTSGGLWPFGEVQRHPYDSVLRGRAADITRRTCCRVLSDRRRWLSSAVPLDRLVPLRLLPGLIPVNRGLHGGA